MRNEPAAGGSSPCPFCDKLSGLERLPPEEVVAEFTYSLALLGPWQFYHGYCVLVARRHATELSRLEPVERRGYLDEMCVLAAAIEACFGPHKLNYELLGNQVPHLHWHLFPRYAHDPDVLHPVWLALDRAGREEPLRRRLETGPRGRAATAAALRRCLEELGAPSA